MSDETTVTLAFEGQPHQPVSVRTVKDLIYVTRALLLRRPPLPFQLLHNDRVLDPSSTLRQAGVVNQDIVEVRNIESGSDLLLDSFPTKDASSSFLRTTDMDCQRVFESHEGPGDALNTPSPGGRNSSGGLEPLGSKKSSTNNQRRANRAIRREEEGLDGVARRPDDNEHASMDQDSESDVYGFIVYGQGENHPHEIAMQQMIDQENSGENHRFEESATTTDSTCPSQNAGPTGVLGSGKKPPLVENRNDKSSLSSPSPGHGKAVARKKSSPPKKSPLPKKRRNSSLKAKNNQLSPKDKPSITNNHWPGVIRPNYQPYHQQQQQHPAAPPQPPQPNNNVPPDDPQDTRQYYDKLVDFLPKELLCIVSGSLPYVAGSEFSENPLKKHLKGEKNHLRPQAEDVRKEVQRRRRILNGRRIQKVWYQNMTMKQGTVWLKDPENSVLSPSEKTYFEEKLREMFHDNGIHLDRARQPMSFSPMVDKFFSNAFKKFRTWFGRTFPIPCPCIDVAVVTHRPREQPQQDEEELPGLIEEQP